MKCLLGVLALTLGYLLFAWGGGALLLWRNSIGRLAGGVAIVIGIAFVWYGFDYLLTDPLRVESFQARWSGYTLTVCAITTSDGVTHRSDRCSGVSAQ